MNNNKNNKANKLKSYEWHIYNFIKERSENGLWTHIPMIMEYLNSIGIDISHRTVIRTIRNIKECPIIQKIILSSRKYGYRFMTNDEELDYLEKRKISILKSLKNYWRDIERFNKNNQQRITFSDYERDFIESLLKNNTQ